MEDHGPQQEGNHSKLGLAQNCSFPRWGLEQ